VAVAVAQRLRRLLVALAHPPAVEDDISIVWDCRRLIVGTGAAGSLPVTDELVREAERRHVELVAMPTSQAIEALRAGSPDTNEILHVTC
jgi:hypothetical protein